MKVPNADEGKEFGTDMTDFFAGGLFAKRWGNLTLLLNADFAILGNPRTADPRQDDVLFFKAGSVYSFSPAVVACLGAEGIGFSRYGNDRLFAGGGISWVWRKMILDAGVAAGLTEASGDFQVRAGLSFLFGAERKPATLLSR